MNDSGTSSAAPAQVEERLRAALAARAHSVGPADLGPLPAPTVTARPRRVPLHRAALGMLALAAVAALVFFAVRGGPPRPAEPARPPHPTVEAPSSAAPSPTPSNTAVPSPSTPFPEASQP
ncbi:hypothetical protein AB0D11_14550 [Streptomyces monashensis]|uniref:hypothetical protein n=1 Tax=Streptomyces monashensis TaxID=1678012 RepID=UPI00340539E8